MSLIADQGVLYYVLDHSILLKSSFNVVSGIAIWL